MNRCPITYESSGDRQYNEKGLHLLASGLKDLHPLDYTAEEQRKEAMLRASKMSIQGVQPKLSAVLLIKQCKFEIVDRYGKYILKPQHHIFPELPQNEDLSMRMAETIGIEVPLHGLIYSRDNSLTYFIKRFDRSGHKDKIPVEDMTQLSGLTRETKYNYTMEKLVKLIYQYCTFPALEMVKLFKLVLFNYLIGNEDMHLKNYSVITKDNITKLSPAYDLLNTTIILKEVAEEIALPVKGEKRNLTYNILVNYFGKECCGLPNKVIEKVIDSIQMNIPAWFNLVEVSFLSDPMKIKYGELLQKRIQRMGW